MSSEPFVSNCAATALRNPMHRHFPAPNCLEPTKQGDQTPPFPTEYSDTDPTKQCGALHVAQSKAAAGVRFVAVKLNGAQGPATKEAAAAGLEGLLGRGRRIPAGPRLCHPTFGPF